MTTISKEYQFAASHQLWRDDWDEVKNEEVFGKCSRLHGHNYTVIIEVAGQPVPEDGMVLNYYTLDDIADRTFMTLDHYHLNDVLPPLGFTDIPTAENLAQFIYTWLISEFNTRMITYFNVTVKESPKTSARYPS